MKIISLNLFFILFLTLTLSAYPVDKKTATTVALNFMSNKSKNQVKISKIDEHYTSGVKTLYVVNFEPAAFVIVSADDATVPVFAYSDENGFDIKNMSPEAKLWFDYYEQSVFLTGKIKSDDTSKRYKWDKILDNDFNKTTKAVAPLSTIRWNQRHSFDGECNTYNYFVPELDTENNCSSCTGQKCPAGCVAVAMGQIMRYWAYPVKKWGKYFDWCSMPETINYKIGGNLNPNYEMQRDVTARFLLGVGQSVNMNYCAGGDCGSSATDLNAHPAFENYGYEDADLIRRQYHTDKQWKEKLWEELDNHRLVYYSGTRVDGIFSYAGHAFVCEGYGQSNDDDFFWFNMGWNVSGSISNGYYYIDNIVNDYTFLQHAIIKLYPTSEYDCNNSISILPEYEYDSYWSDSQYFSPVYGNIFSSPESVIINTGETVTYTAHNSIELSNFEVESGADFTAQIEQCSSNCTQYVPPAKQAEKNSTEKSIQDEQIAQLSESIKLYPNPANNTLHIEYSGTDATQVGLFDVYGKRMYSSYLQPGNTQINVSELPSGVYVIRISGAGDFVHSQKIIIAR